MFFLIDSVRYLLIFILFLYRICTQICTQIYTTRPIAQSLHYFTPKHQTPAFPMSSTLYLTRTCAHCGQSFTARTTTTRYCSASCNGKAYKAKLRAERTGEPLAPAPPKTRRQGRRSLEELCQKELLTVSETARYLGVSRPAVYGYLERNELASIRLGSKTFISRPHLLALFDDAPTYRARPNVHQLPEDTLYTASEIETHYPIKRTRIYQLARAYQWLKVQINGQTLFDKATVDRYFADHLPPTQRFYTVEEATQRFGLSRDSLYKFIETYRIEKIKEGRYIKINKTALDELFKNLL